MIIKSHIRGGYRAAADYLKEQGQNEKTRLVHISDPDASTLDEAFQNMWAIANNSKVQKPLHHISINPHKDERLTDAQVTKIIERCEQKFGYKPNDHQRVIVEHLKDGRQHFHVIWNRVSLTTGKAVWPGHHWNKSKQASREMEQELGLKRPTPRRLTRSQPYVRRTRKGYRKITSPRYSKSIQRPRTSRNLTAIKPFRLPRAAHYAAPSRPTFYPGLRFMKGRRRKHYSGNPRPINLPEPIQTESMTRAEIIAWAWENGRWDILAMYGIYVDFGL